MGSNVRGPGDGTVAVPYVRRQAVTRGGIFLLYVSSNPHLQIEKASVHWRHPTVYMWAGRIRVALL